MPSTVNNVYILGSQATEEKPRLNDGQDYFNILTDGELLPSCFEINKDAPIRIADVATGTGRWLMEIYEQISKSTSSTFVGFDISSNLFPASKTNPAGVSFAVHDIRLPFSSRFLGSFDVVHVRFLAYAFKKDEWDFIVRNITTLLKPGGYLLWEDSDYSLISSIPSSPAFNEMMKIDTEFALKIGRDIKHTSTLLSRFQSAGLIHCDQTTMFSTDKPELKDMTNDLVLRLFSTSLKGAILQGGVEGCRTDQEMNAIIDSVKYEVDNGGLEIVHGTRRIWGRMPFEDVE